MDTYPQEAQSLENTVFILPRASSKTSLAASPKATGALQLTGNSQVRALPVPCSQRGKPLSSVVWDFPARHHLWKPSPVRTARDAFLENIKMF